MSELVLIRSNMHLTWWASEYALNIRTRAVHFLVLLGKWLKKNAQSESLSVAMWCSLSLHKVALCVSMFWRLATLTMSEKSKSTKPYQICKETREYSRIVLIWLLIISTPVSLALMANSPKTRSFAFSKISIHTDAVTLSGLYWTLGAE
jgi:hypothetical protein